MSRPRPGHPKTDFSDHRATQQLTELDGEDGDHRRQRHLERVAQDHRALAQPLGVATRM